MAKRKLKEFDEYSYGPRRTLHPGDRFRVKGGPVYIMDDGKQVPMYERGVFVFQKYCERGAQRWIEARRSDGGTSVLWVGRSMRSPAVSSLRRRPYRITRKIQPARRVTQTQDLCHG
jgi:hypothetical protein